MSGLGRRCRSTIDSLNYHCTAGIEANRERIEENLHRSLMLATALNPHIGYGHAAEVAKAANAQGKTLRDMVVEKGLMSGERFDDLMVPAQMVRPRATGDGVHRAGPGGGSACVSFNLFTLGLRLAARGKTLWSE